MTWRPELHPRYAASTANATSYSVFYRTHRDEQKPTKHSRRTAVDSAEDEVYRAWAEVYMPPRLRPASKPRKRRYSAGSEDDLYRQLRDLTGLRPRSEP